MSKIVRTIEAYVGETVRIRWRRRLYDETPNIQAVDELLEQDHTAPPEETWKARKLDTALPQSEFYPRTRYGSKYDDPPKDPNEP